MRRICRCLPRSSSGPRNGILALEIADSEHEGEDPMYRKLRIVRIECALVRFACGQEQVPSLPG